MDTSHNLLVALIDIIKKLCVYAIFISPIVLAFLWRRKFKPPEPEKHETADR
jgi:hypothetical protein